MRDELLQRIFNGDTGQSLILLIAVTFLWMGIMTISGLGEDDFSVLEVERVDHASHAVSGRLFWPAMGNAADRPELGDVVPDFPAYVMASPPPGFERHARLSRFDGTYRDAAPWAGFALRELAPGQVVEVKVGSKMNIWDVSSAHYRARNVAYALYLFVFVFSLANGVVGVVRRRRSRPGEMSSGKGADFE